MVSSTKIMVIKKRGIIVEQTKFFQQILIIPWMNYETGHQANGVPRK